MDVGFLILCPDKNVSGLKITLNSIKNHTYDREVICVVGDNADANELKEFKQYCQTYKAGNKITSLINVGIKKMKSKWVFILFEGSKIQNYLEKKLEAFAKKESDVLFPVFNRNCNFVEGPFNGVMINKDFFKKVGDFNTEDMQKEGLNDFEFSKMLWAMNAIENKVIFKAIVGLRII